MPNWTPKPFFRSAQRQPHGLVTRAVTHGQKFLCLVSCSAVAISNFLITFEWQAPHFHFALGSANHVASPEHP